MQPFPDYGFKLVVLQELLETGSFAEELKKLEATPSIAQRLSGEKDYGEIIGEIEQFFRSVELTPEDFLEVTKLCFDSGNDIYHLIRPFWGGESDEFDVLSVDGFEKLENLRSALYCSMIKEDQLERLSSAGILVE